MRSPTWRATRARPALLTAAAWRTTSAAGRTASARSGAAPWRRVGATRTWSRASASGTACWAPWPRRCTRATPVSFATRTRRTRWSCHRVLKWFGKSASLFQLGVDSSQLTMEHLEFVLQRQQSSEQMVVDVVLVHRSLFQSTEKRIVQRVPDVNVFPVPYVRSAPWTLPHDFRFVSPREPEWLAATSRHESTGF